MDYSAISVRYAKAFFMLAKEKNKLDVLKKDIEQVSGLYAHSKNFVLFLESPVIKTSKKLELIDSIFEAKINDLTMKFLNMIIRNKREVYLPGICHNFLKLARKDQNILSATLTTATEIDPTVLSKIKSLVEKELNAKVELTSKTDSKIIGGMVLRLDDKQYDASVAAQLKKIKQELLQSELK